MPDWLKALIAGFTAKKLGGGCLSTILIFVIVYYALGQCNRGAVHHAVLHGTEKVQSKLIAANPK
jgi:hypothetical protein